MKFPKIRFPYYYVPPCPKCGSMETGRIVKQPGSHADYTMMASLKNGEIIMFDPSPSPTDNLFCLHCGNVWTGEVTLRMLSKSQISYEAKKRGTLDLLQEFKKANGLDVPRRHSVVDGWFPFLHF